MSALDTAGSTTLIKLRRRAAGLVFLLLAAFGVWLSIAFYQKKFSDVAWVTLYTDSVGNEMHPQAEVQLRGVVVGEVRSIGSDGQRAKLRLAMQPDQLDHIPANVSAVMMPTTLFGERYVNLVPPRTPGADHLSAGDTIRQDDSADAIELQQAWDHLLPTLRAVQPAKLSVTLTAIAHALRGNGTRLGKTLKRINRYLGTFNKHLPTLDSDISELARVTRTYSQAAPGIINTLDDFTVTGRTLVQQREQLNKLYATMTGASQDLTTFLRQNQGNMIQLSAHSRDTLRILARYAPEFPCTLKMLTRFEPNMDKALGKGTDEPGLHVTLHVLQSKGRYVPGKDTPRYHDDSGPHCYSVPYGGASLRDGTTPAKPTAAPTKTTVVAAGLGMADSPQEGELVNELLAPSLRVPHGSLPDWSSVLVGPIFRGTKVKLK